MPIFDEEQNRNEERNENLNEINYDSYLGRVSSRYQFVDRSSKSRGYLTIFLTNPIWMKLRKEAELFAKVKDTSMLGKIPMGMAPDRIH